MRSSPTPPQVQVFGVANSQATRAAERWFRERRLATHLVDLRKRPIAPGELRRFVDRFGPLALADIEGRAWREAGLGYLAMDDEDLVRRLLDDQRLLRLPLVRSGNALAIGRDEAAWKAVAEAATTAAGAVR